MFNQKQAEYFLEIVNCGSITEASRRLFISQPALSQMIKNLEKELEFPLFMRGTTPLQLTKSGERMVSIARNVLTFQEGIEEQINSLKDAPTHSFHIGVLFGQAEGIISNVLIDFVRTHPKVEISIVETGSRNIERMILNGKIDIGILSGLPTNSSFHYVPIKDDTMVILAAKQSKFSALHENGSTINFDELADQSLVAKPAGTYSRLLLDTLSQLYGVPLNIKYELENLSPFVSILDKIDCVTMMPKSYYDITPKLYTTMNYYYLNYSETHYQELLCYHKNLFISEDLNDFLQTVVKYESQ